MSKPSGQQIVAALLSFNGGFVDAVSFLGLQGLFTAHVTGNFVTLAAALVLGHQGILNKVLALPEFVVVVALARLAGLAMRKVEWPALTLLLAAQVGLLLAFWALAVRYGPFPDADTPIALATGLAGVAAMAIQNAVQRVHLSNFPPTTIMTNNTTQVTLDTVDLVTGAASDATRTRYGPLAAAVLIFAGGCAAAAFLFYLYGFWCLLLAVLVSGAAATVAHFESN